MSTAMSTSHELEQLKSLLSDPEIIPPTRPSYASKSQVWSAQKSLSPSLVIEPTSLSSLSKCLKFLAQSSLDFDVRSSGTGSATARDVLISMAGFKDFAFDREKEEVLLGAGCLWSEYYARMEEVAPGYTVVAARTPFLGVGGSVLSGGFGWMSGEYGCSSDPKNLLDAQVVKLDGSVVWASEEPDLLWGLRGAQVGLGVVTNFRLRAYKYPRDIWAGMVLLPRTCKAEIAAGIASMDDPSHANYIGDDGRVSFFVYDLAGPHVRHFGGDGEEDVLVIQVYDAHGEAHGRKVFSWVLEIPGAIDTTKVMSLRDVANLQAPAEGMKGTTKVWFNPLGVERMTEDIVLNAWAWREDVKKAGGSVGEAGYMLLEAFSCRGSLSDPKDSAWPRSPKLRHVILCGVGCGLDAPAEEVEKAQELVKAAPAAILGSNADESMISPNGIEHWHDLRAIYGDNYDKLMALKKRYDPGNKLKGPLRWM